MHSHLDALGAGSAVPENGDALTAGTVQDALDQESSNGLDSDAHSHGEQAQIEKRAQTARARAALIGATLVDMPDDAGRREWLLTRWTLTRSFHHLGDLEKLLDRMGAPA